MKTTTIGRIGAIVAGAAMLGTAVASAFAGAVEVPSGVTKGFFVSADGVPQVQVVVGEKAAASDGAAAAQIAAMIGNMAFGTTTVSKAGGSMEVQGGTTTCTPSAAECAAGSAEGQVKLSWAALGLIGDLEQKQMTCDIYESDEDLTYSTDGGDGISPDYGATNAHCDPDYSCSGDWTDFDSEFLTNGEYVEVYTPEDTVANTLIGSCEVTATDVTILKKGEFPNEICSICYNFCDIALGCEPHMMSEWVEIYGDRMSVEYNCDTERLEFSVDEDGAILYNVFTDDILTEDILDANDDLVGQSYLGKIILGQHEYYVEDIDEDSYTIVCGGKGTVSTSAPMVYTPPAEGSSCDAADSGMDYSIKLVGAQTIEEKGVVDVTIEVTKPDGTTEQVTSGISGTPVVGDIKVKLQRGTAASNVITGEQSFSADLLVWYVPSEYTFDSEASTQANDGLYDEMGVALADGTSDLDDVGIAWQLAFNGDPVSFDDTEVLVSDVEELEDEELLLPGSDYEMDEDIDENTHWDDCYEDAASGDMSVDIVRYMQWALMSDDEVELAENEMIQLPFNDAKYLLSDLKFGYKGLYDSDFLGWDMQDKTTATISVDTAEVYSIGNFEDWVIADFDYFDYLTAVTLDYIDDEGMDWSVRVDEGPFTGGEKVLFGNKVLDLGSIRGDSDDADDENEIWNVTYTIWDANNEESDEYYVEFFEGGDNEAEDDNYYLLIDSQVQDVNVTPDFANDTELVLATGKGVWPDTSIWYIDDADYSDEDDAQLYIDVQPLDNLEDEAGYTYDGVIDLVSGFDVDTEFENDVKLRGEHVVDGDGIDALDNLQVPGIVADESGLADTNNITEDDWIVLYSRSLGGGQTQTGAEDQVWIQLDDSTYYWLNSTDEGHPDMQSIVFVDEDQLDQCEMGGDCDNIQTGDNDGVLLSLSGALVEVTGDTDVEEPEDSNFEESDVISTVELTVPENEMRPTIFFGLEGSTNTTSITITEADQGSVVNIGGVDATVEEFGVSISGGGVVVGGTQTSVTCPSKTVSCPDVSVETKAPAAIGYKLVVLDSEGTSKSNLVLVGGPAVNSMTKGIIEVSELCPSNSVIKQVGSKLVVAGCEAADTASAAQALATWLKAAV